MSICGFPQICGCRRRVAIARTLFFAVYRRVASTHGALQIFCKTMEYILGARNTERNACLCEPGARGVGPWFGARARGPGIVFFVSVAKNEQAGPKAKPLNGHCGYIKSCRGARDCVKQNQAGEYMSAMCT